MNVLTEAMVTQRTRQPLAEVKKLNLWAQGLSDVSILAKAETLEILCLSSNQIKTLQNFPVCPALTQLILRNNQITDLEQIQHLPKLHMLWLAENLIEKHPQYLEKVLATLPALIQFDDNDLSDPQLRLRCSLRLSARQEPRPPSFPDLPEPECGDSPPHASPRPRGEVQSQQPLGQSQKLAGQSQKLAGQSQKLAGQSQKLAGQPQNAEAVSPRPPQGQPVKKLLDPKQLVSRQVSDLSDPGSSRRIPRETEEHILSAVLGLLPELNHESLDQVIFRCRKLSEK
jgi:hypothetical protein